MLLCVKLLVLMPLVLPGTVVPVMPAGHKVPAVQVARVARAHSQLRPLWYTVQ
jgi:hypothetical protein